MAIGVFHPWTGKFGAQQLSPGACFNRTKRMNSGRVVASASKEMAVILEIDGVVADIHKYGHRQSFNRAFRKLGLDCANWTEPVYLDLLRQAGNDEEQMLTTFFNKIGWPMALPTNEKSSFVEKLMQLKDKELESLAATDSIPIRPDLTRFLDEAVKELVPIAFVTSYSKCGERVSRILVDKLGKDVKVVGSDEVANSVYGQVVLGLGVSSSPDELLAQQVAKAVSTEKQRLAEELASKLKVRVDIDTTSSVQLKRTIAALRAAAELTEMSIDRCVLLAGAFLGTEAASRIGIPCILVQSSLTARADFPLAKTKLEGFGPGGITIGKLRKYLS